MPTDEKSKIRHGVPSHPRDVPAPGAYRSLVPTRGVGVPKNDRMKTVRLGYVKYLNTLPLVEGLGSCRDLEMVAAVPSLLAGMLMRGEVDLALASLVDFAQARGELVLVPAGMIGCAGATLTVRVFSQRPIEETRRLHADTDSHTSVVLAQVILAERYGLRPPVVAFDARERHEVADGQGDARAQVGSGSTPEWPETLLLIGDKVVTDSPPAVRYPYQLDLGEAWWAMTGKPFVYAMWMARRRDVQGPRWADLRTAADLLERQRLRNLARTQWMIDRAAGERRWPVDLATRYVTEFLRYEVTPEARAGAAEFLRRAARLGLLPAVEPVYAESGAVAGV